MSTIYPDDRPELLAVLKRPPRVAWPALLIMVAAYAFIIAAWVQCLSGAWPFWAGMVVISLSSYAMFTPAHDAMHRSVSRMPWLNEAVLRISTFLAVPFGKGHLFRIMHMRHHRFTNEDGDPDHALASSLKLMPLWGFWPFLYLVYYARDPAACPGLRPAEVWREMLLGMGIVTACFVWNAEAMLWLWLLPLYFSFFLMCLVFMVLPHYPHAVRESDNRWRASLMRRGHEWLLTPLLMYQNYHLMHHLYPTVPFHRYGRAWRARRGYHEAHDPGVVAAFGLGPKH